MTQVEDQDVEYSGEKKIARARPHQAETLSQIAAEAKGHWGYPKKWMEAWSPLLTIYDDYIQMYDTYVANIGGNPAGFYALSLDGEKARLDHLWVRPEFMGQGVGKLLLKHALGLCLKYGVAVLEIESDPNAQGFYEKMGARKVGKVQSTVDGQPRSLPLMEIKISNIV
jgi:GNAT superfamily N-acetyltransferase